MCTLSSQVNEEGIAWCGPLTLLELRYHKMPSSFFFFLQKLSKNLKVLPLHSPWRWHSRNSSLCRGEKGNPKRWCQAQDLTVLWQQCLQVRHRSRHLQRCVCSGYIPNASTSMEGNAVTFPRRSRNIVHPRRWFGETRALWSSWPHDTVRSPLVPPPTTCS